MISEEGKNLVPKLFWAGLIGFLLFHLLTLRGGATWAGSGADLGLSIIHGMNFLEGRSFFDTSAYVTPKILAGGAPHTYPFLYSVFQAGIFESFGFDGFFIASKLFGFACLAGLSFFLARIVVARDGYTTAFLVVPLFLAAPFIFEFKEQIRPDWYFAAMTFGMFWWWEKATHREDHRHLGATLGEAVAMAFFLYAMIATRSLALAMLPALLGHDLITKRRLTVLTLVAVAGAALLYGLQGAFIGVTDKGYAGEFATNAPALAERAMINIQAYIYSLRKYLSFANDDFDIVAQVIFVVSMLSFAVGYVVSALRGLRLHDLFLPCYFAVLLAHTTGSAWARYLIPALPIFFYYVVVGLQFLGEKTLPKFRNIPSVAYTGLILVLYLTVYVTWIPFGPFATGPKGKEFVSVHRLIGEVTPVEAVVMSRDPYWTHLLTGRNTARNPNRMRDPDEDEWRKKTARYLADSEAQYVLVKRTPRQRRGFYGIDAWDVEDLEAFRRWTSEDTARFVEVLNEGSYTLYKVQSLQ